MKKMFENIAWEQYVAWQSDKKILHKINTLIKDIERNGAMQGIGKPEALKGDLSGLYSRRINLEHRLVYTLEDDVLYIIACKTHYKEIKS